MRLSVLNCVLLRVSCGCRCIIALRHELLVVLLVHRLVVACSSGLCCWLGCCGLRRCGGLCRTTNVLRCKGPRCFLRVALGDELLHILLGGVQSISAEGAFHAAEGVFLVGALTHEHQRTTDDQEQHNTTKDEHHGVETACGVLAVGGGLGVVRPLTGERVVGPCALPLTVAVGIENKLATGIDGSLIGLQALTGRQLERD